MTRRGFAAALAAQAAVLWSADEKPPTFALLASLASYLADGNSPGAMSLFSKSMPGYGTLESNVSALAAQYDILCTIEVLDESGGDTERHAEVDWYFELKSKTENGPTERREVKVKLTVAREPKGWRITSLEPRSVLELPKVS